MGEYQESMRVLLYPDPEPKGPVPPLLQCETPCGGRVKRARYRLRIPDTAEAVGGVRRIDVKGPSRFTITTHAPTNRATGLALGLSGIAVFLGGLALEAHGLARTLEGNRSDAEMLVGASLAAVGGTLTIVGFVVFHHNGEPDIRVEPMLAESAGTRHAGVPPVRGLGIAGTGVF